MKAFNILISTIIVLAVLSVSALAGPRPMSFSGNFEEDGQIRIFGQGFGPIPAEGLGAGVQGALAEPVFCLIVGDNPMFADCNFLRKLNLKVWRDQQIDAVLSLEGMSPEADFYFFVVDVNGAMSSGAGPWNLAGPKPRSGRTVALVELDGKLLPWTRKAGFPYIEGWGPAAPGGTYPVLSLYGEFFGEYSDLGHQQIGEVSLSGLGQGLVMGDNQSIGNCSWLVGMSVDEWADDHVFFPLILPDVLTKDTVFFFILDSGKNISNGYPLILNKADLEAHSNQGGGKNRNSGGSSEIELQPGAPGKPRLFGP